MRYPTCALFVCLTALQSGLAQTGTGTIKAIITDSGGMPVSDVYVSASPISSGLANTAVSSKSGEVQINGVRPGTYGICVQRPGMTYLDPCQWDARIPTVTVAAGQTVTASVPPIRAGSILRVRISDPGRRYLAVKGAPPPAFLVGVMAGGRFHPMRVASANESEQVLELPIPFNTPVRLTVNGGQLSLTDEKGAAIDAGGLAVDVQHSAMGSNPDLKFTAVGRR